LLQLLGGGPGALNGILGRSPGRGQGRGRGAGSGPVAAGSAAVGITQTPKPAGATTSAGSAPVVAADQTQQHRPSTPQRTVAAPVSIPGVQLGTLQRIINELNQGQQVLQGPSLTDIVNVEEIIKSGIFNNSEVVAKLAEYLPEGGPITTDTLQNHVMSPQFKQAISMFNQALRTGQLVGIMSSFGLDTSSVGQTATVEDFLRAIQKKAKEESAKEKRT